MGLACPSPQPAGERQGLPGVAGGIVDPPGREVGRRRAQNNERRPGVKLATSELLDGARDQRERLVSTAGEAVGDADGCGNVRCPVDELPRPAEVKASLEELDRARKIPATKVGAPELEQSPEQRPGMVRRFSGPHGGIGMPDGLVEPAELGEHVGEAGLRPSRLDAGGPEALVAQVALERDVPLK